MKSFVALGVSLLGFSSHATAAAVNVERMEMSSFGTRNTIEQRQASTACSSTGNGNGPNSRNCWTPGFSESRRLPT